MPKSRLALVNCEYGQGPWLRATGRETAVRIEGLVKGEECVSVLCHGGEGRNSALAFMFTEPGTFPLDLSNMIEFCVKKDVLNGGIPSKTCVEVLL